MSNWFIEKLEEEGMLPEMSDEPIKVNVRVRPGYEISFEADDMIYDHSFGETRDDKIFTMISFINVEKMTFHGDSPFD